MYLSKLTIKGFRSFGPEGVEIEIGKKMIAFIGLNSSGKTAALEGLRKLFGNKSEQWITREDFHIAFDEDVDDAESKKMSIEVRIEFDDEDDGVPSFFSEMVVEEEGTDPYSRIRLEATWIKSDLTQQGDIDQNLYFIKVAEGEAEEGEAKKHYPTYLRSLIQIIYVPAIRRPTEQIKYASGSILFRVLNNIDFNEEFKQEFDDILGEINNLFLGIKEFETVQKSLQHFWSQFHKDSRYKESNLNFGTSELESILKKLEVNFSPAPGSRKFYVDDLGDGYRSLFYLTLVCALLDIEEKLVVDDEVDRVKRPLLTILAIEEPENHIAPQLLGRVVKILQEIAKKSNTQVFLTSHTPAIIKRLDPETIFHFQISKESETVVNGIELPDKADEAYKYVKEAVQNFPEIYFAKLVVIGEGDSEEVIFNRLMRLKRLDFDDNIITFAPLGHRFVNHIWKLLQKLEIPFVTLLDLDLERDGGGWGRIKYVAKELIANGEDKKEILGTTSGVLKDEELEEMHTWEIDVDDILAWASFFEEKNVFFSSLLDIDFLMLEAYKEYYTGKESYPEGGGPRIPDKSKKPDKYNEYLVSAIHATLKSEDVQGEHYSESQHELMIWYKYHFLGRGKPGTHIQVLPLISNKVLGEKLPGVFDRIFKRIKDLLG